MKKYIISFIFCFCCLHSHPWMDELIQKEFASFSEGISLETVDRIEKQWHRYRRYKIINNKVYGPGGKIYNLLEYLCIHYRIPDVDFIYLNEDGFIRGPKGERNPSTTEGPVFASTKHADFTHVLYFADWNFDPTRTDPGKCSQSYDWGYNWKIVEDTVRTMPWEKKISKAFWRGGLQGYQYDYSPKGFNDTPRGKLCYYSYLYPDLLDAGTNYSENDRRVKRIIDTLHYNPSKGFNLITYQLRYKYLVEVDGHTCTYPGFQWRLLSNCTVLKQETENRMWYYFPLRPWVHYVPLKKDLSDLMEKICWCIENDDEARKIADQGRKFAKENIMPEHCCLYCVKALRKYASLQKFKPSL